MGINYFYGHYELGADHFQIQIALYWIKLRHKPEQIQNFKQSQIESCLTLYYLTLEYKAFCI